MKLKNEILKYLIILIVFELILDVLKLLINSKIQYLEDSYFFTIFRAVLFILLLKDLYKSKAKFEFAVLIVLTFPVLIQIIQVCLGNIFINFCPQQTNYNGEPNITNLLNEMQNNSCSFPTSFQFFPYIEHPIFCIKVFFSTNEFSHLLGFVFSPYIFYFFLFFKFCLFKVFKENNRNPYLSLVPIVNKITLLKICQFPFFWIFILVIPFVRLFNFYKMNIQLCEIQNISKSNALWATLFPPIFYGKFVFR